MIRNIIAQFITLALILTSMPVFATAQTRQTSGPGTSAYYSDDSVIRTVTRRVSIKRLGWIHIGGDPQVKGGLYNIPPAADEYDEDLKETITVTTMSRSRVLYIGQVTPTMDRNGETIQIRVRRKKVTHKIIAIVNCGNWSRQIGAEVKTVIDVQKETIYEDCKPGNRDKVRDEIVGDTHIEEYFDGCHRETIKTITKLDIRVECPPDSWLEVVRAGNDRGKVSGKKFLAEEMIPAEIREQILTQEPSLRGKKVKFLQVLQGACESEKHKFKLVWFTGDSGGWHWKEFLIGLGVGFLIGYVVRGTPDSPVLNPPGYKEPIKNQPGTNPRPNPGTGATPPGTIGTRPRRPSRNEQ